MTVPYPDWLHPSEYEEYEKIENDIFEKNIALFFQPESIFIQEVMKRIRRHRETH